VEPGGGQTPGPSMAGSVLADRIADLVEVQYAKLVAELPPRFSKRKVCRLTLLIVH
jgi:hypothetical protein